MTRIGYYLRSIEKPHPVLAFMFVSKGERFPCIGEVLTVQGMRGIVESYDIVPPMKV